MDNRDSGPEAKGAVPARRPLRVADRQKFWVDTCREAARAHKGSPRVLEFYQKYGCRFSVPSIQQVRDVLEALDAALPTWEQQHPELFYRTLELNFPELLRQP